MTQPVTTLVESLLACADGQPDRIAVLAPTYQVAWGELARMVRAAAFRLLHLGLSHGDHVLLCGPNSPEWAAAYFAIHAAGGVATLVDADIHDQDARWAAEHSESRLALASRDLNLDIPTEDIADFVEPRGTQLTESPRGALGDAADLIYTTGTTGAKKGVVLEHRHIAQAAMNINAFLQTAPSDVEVVPIPLSHSFGLGRLRCMALVGHALALEPGMRNPVRLLKRVLDLKATGLALVPAGFQLVLNMTKGHLADARDHLRYIEIGSAAMPMETKRQLMELLPGTRLCHHYGLTEASRAAFIEYHGEQDKLATVGRASPNVEIAIHDDHDRPVPAGQGGELVVRGGMVMREYWMQPALTRQVLRGGWLRTGDRALQDADGYVHLIGRDSECVNVGGMKVNPEEIERHLNKHPAVVESACLGVPDPGGITGECVKACVVVREDVADEELIEWLRGRLEEYKVPRVWQRVERISKTSSGKIQRHLMRGEGGQQ